MDTLKSKWGIAMMLVLLSLLTVSCSLDEEPQPSKPTDVELTEDDEIIPPPAVVQTEETISTHITKELVVEQEDSVSKAEFHLHQLHSQRSLIQALLFQELNNSIP